MVIYSLVFLCLPSVVIQRIFFLAIRKKEEKKKEKKLNGWHATSF
jgi:hypothetical protein